MRRQAKPFAVEIRKSRRPAGVEPLLPPEEIAPAPAARFAEADRLLRLTPPAAAGETAVGDQRPRNVLPDLSIPAAPVETNEAPRRRRTATGKIPVPKLPPKAAAPAETSPKGVRAKRIKPTPEAALPAPARLEPRPPARVEIKRPTATAAAPRRRDPRPARGEFLPGQRWKRRLAPILR